MVEVGACLARQYSLQDAASSRVVIRSVRGGVWTAHYARNRKCHQVKYFFTRNFLCEKHFLYFSSKVKFIIDYYRLSEDWRLIFGGGETYSAMFKKNSKNFVKKRMNKVFYACCLSADSLDYEDVIRFPA